MFTDYFAVAGYYGLLDHTVPEHPNEKSINIFDCLNYQFI